jgi:eukaryotic-like serine/threonine-protein kinase
VIGRVVGKYRLLHAIGEGGMGVVYRAEHLVLGSPAAVKVLQPQFTRSSQVVDRFFTEAKATSAIRHPGIVEVFDYGRLPNDQAYIAMELLRGEDLTSMLARQGRLEPALAAQICLQLLSALEAAHVRGIVHRDIKPDNIYLVRDPSAPGAIRVKILDFGIAKLMPDVHGPKAKTRGSSILGTPAYMAPEQCKGGIEVDARADLYAVGCILFELLVGRPPFVAEGGGEVMAMHIYQPPPRLFELAPHLPPELDTLLAKMLAKSPDQRTPSAAWALAALERVGLPPVVAEVQLVGRAPTPSPELLRAARHTRSRPRFPVAVLAIAVVLAAAAATLIGLS